MPGLGPTPKLLASHDIKKPSRRAPNVPLFDEMDPDDENVGPPPTYTPEFLDNPHPTDLPEGMIEKLIKKAGEFGDYVDSDRIYLEQYLHPERDIIPKQPLRPTRGGMGPSDDMIYRRLPEAQIDKKSEGFPLTDGLGIYTKSKGDKYNSAYDEWDFNTNAELFGMGNSPLSSAANWAAKKFMQNVGTPFKVYERYNKDKHPELFDNPDYTDYEKDEGYPDNDWSKVGNTYKKKGKK